ncbi:MAG TPA: MEDS domain-containing protein [Anaerolineae bacterium]|nr:MEDS domain-containing protein [Anaerolineae bacterium]
MYLHTSDQPVLALGFGDYTCNWGVHICGLYETEAERDAIVMGYLHQGDMAHDLQLYCPVERTADDFVTMYSALYPDCAAHLQDTHCFQMHSAREFYYPDGIFSPWVMDAKLNAFYTESQAHGPRNVRATAEMAWALEAIPGVEHLMAYESRLNYFIPGKPWISICLYNVTKFSGTTIMDVLRTHPYAISGGVITENPYYQDPDLWLARNAPEFLPPPNGKN